MRRAAFFWLIIGFLAAGGGIVAIAEERVEITGERISGDTRQQVTFITGNVRIVQGETRLSAAQATIYLKEKRLQLTGQVRFENSQTVVRANYLEYALRQKTGFFREDVVLQHRMKPAEEGADRGVLFLISDQVYFDANTQAMAAVSGRFKQADFSGGADRISYDDDLGELLLAGAAYFKKAHDEEIRSERIHIQLHVKRFVAEGNVTVSFEVDDGAANPSGSQSEESEPVNDNLLKDGWIGE